MTARRAWLAWLARRPVTAAALLLAAAGALAAGPLGPLGPLRALQALQAAEGRPTAAVTAGALRVPDVTLIDQDGRKVRFASDVVAGKVVAVSFIFTSCTTICPPIGATFGKLRTLLGSRAGTSVQLISVSVDPLNDTPARLKAWAGNFGGAGPGWTLLTGPKADVERLLKALQAYTPNFADHSPLLLLGNAATGTWERTSGLVPAADIAAQLVRLGAPPAEPRRPASGPAAPGQTAPGRSGLGRPVPAANVSWTDAAAAGSWMERAPATPAPPSLPAPAGPVSAARKYFTDVELVDQDGRTHRLYTDLLQGRTVVIEAFFTACSGACPVMAEKLAGLQQWLGDRLGKDVYLLSISVDPQTDTPARLKQYAARLGARPGWFFLTGKKENVDWALYKLGHYVEHKEDHSNLLILGNEPTGLWKKVFGLARSEDLIRSLDAVLHNQG